MTDDSPKMLRTTDRKETVSTHDSKRTTGPESLVSSARGSPVVAFSTMKYATQQFRLNGAAQITDQQSLWGVA